MVSQVRGGEIFRIGTLRAKQGAALVLGGTLSRMSCRPALLGAVLLLVAGAAVAQPQDGPPLRVLSDTEMTRYVASLGELVALGKEADGAVGSDPKQARALAAGFAQNLRMRQAIESRGFTAESFVDVHWNAMMAYAELEMEKHRGELEKARKEQEAAFESMRSQMPPEQFEKMMQGMKGMSTILDAYRNVPPANVALVKKHKPQLDAILNR